MFVHVSFCVLVGIAALLCHLCCSRQVNWFSYEVLDRKRNSSRQLNIFPKIYFKRVWLNLVELGYLILYSVCE